MACRTSRRYARVQSILGYFFEDYSLQFLCRLVQRVTKSCIPTIKFIQLIIAHWRNILGQTRVNPKVTDAQARFNSFSGLWRYESDGATRSRRRYLGEIGLRHVRNREPNILREEKQSRTRVNESLLSFAAKRKGLRYLGGRARRARTCCKLQRNQAGLSLRFIDESLDATG